MLDLWLWQLKAVAPIVGGICFSNFVEMQGDLCNFRQPPDLVLQYPRQNPEDACYRDGIFYPRCKDLENPQVLHYHNLLKNNHEKVTVSSCIPFEHTCFCTNSKGC